MKKIFLSIVGGVAVLAVVGYVLREPLFGVLKEQVTKDMFVSADADDFDAGLSIGTTFPPINALYQGAVLSDTGQFINDKGMVFIANRSAHW